MDPIYSSSILSSASRQVIDTRWPADGVDREMTCWSPGANHPAPTMAGSILLPVRTMALRLVNWLRRPATSTAG